MGRGDFGFGLCDHRFLRMAGGTEIGESCLFGGNSADGLDKSGSVVRSSRLTRTSLTRTSVRGENG